MENISEITKYYVNQEPNELVNFRTNNIHPAHEMTIYVKILK